MMNPHKTLSRLQGAPTSSFSYRIFSLRLGVFARDVLFYSGCRSNFRNRSDVDRIRDDESAQNPIAPARRSYRQFFLSCFFFASHFLLLTSYFLLLTFYFSLLTCYLGFRSNFRSRSYIVGRLTPSNSAACDILPPT